MLASRAGRPDVRCGGAGLVGLVTNGRSHSLTLSAFIFENELEFINL